MHNAYIRIIILLRTHYLGVCIIKVCTWESQIRACLLWTIQILDKSGFQIPAVLILQSVLFFKELYLQKYVQCAVRNIWIPNYLVQNWNDILKPNNSMMGHSFKIWIPDTSSIRIPTMCISILYWSNNCCLKSKRAFKYSPSR